MNDYEKIALTYNKSHEKPDKRYSILPTILNIVSLIKNPEVIFDLGCGDGFFTFPLARLFPEALVLGFDNSLSQINLANKNMSVQKLPNLEFVLKDVFVQELPTANLIIAPFLLNYLPTEKSLKTILQKLFDALLRDGNIIFVFDSPRGFDNTRFGAKKEIIGKKIKLTLYKNEKEKICGLESYFYPPETILKLLKEIGFNSIKFHQPIISGEGYTNLGKDFWQDFIEQSELLYISAKK